MAKEKSGAQEVISYKKRKSARLEKIARFFFYFVPLLLIVIFCVEFSLFFI